MNKLTYEKDFLDCASKLDATSKGYGKITECAQTIVKGDDNNSARMLLNIISTLVDSEELSKETKYIAKALNDSLIKYLGYLKILDICGRDKTEDDIRSLSELLNDLNNLIGLKEVKSQVNDLISYQKIQKKRENVGLLTSKSTLHLAFTGGPGTGKTTVARIVGRIYKRIGLLSRGHFVEVSRTDLIAGYQGQTALKVKKVIEMAKGGVLFIDEAYSITENDHSDSYGRECLTELTKALEDYRHDLVVIVAGYTEPMNKFFNSNPGLKSRFNTFIEFRDYAIDEMLNMLVSMCKKNDYNICDEAQEIICSYLTKEIESKEKPFSNGRLVRNVYDKIIMNHAKRVVEHEDPDHYVLSEITAYDCWEFQGQDTLANGKY